MIRCGLFFSKFGSIFKSCNTTKSFHVKLRVKKRRETTYKTLFSLLSPSFSRALSPLLVFVLALALHTRHFRFSLLINILRLWDARGP